MIDLTRDEYLSHEFWQSDDVLSVPNARRNPGHRFKVRLFDTPEKLYAWHGGETTRMLRHRFPNAVGSLSALPSIISLHAVGPEPVVHEARSATGSRPIAGCLRSSRSPSTTRSSSRSTDRPGK